MNANAKVVAGFLRIEVDKWAAIKPATPSDEIKDAVNIENNLSEVEYELVPTATSGKETHQQETDMRGGRGGRGRGGRGRGRGGQDHSDHENSEEEKSTEHKDHEDQEAHRGSRGDRGRGGRGYRGDRGSRGRVGRG